MERQTPYCLSTDYALLYQWLCDGLTVVGFVDHESAQLSELSGTPRRDVCMIRRDAAWTITAWGRGIAYLSLYPWSAEGMHNPHQFSEAEMLAADCRQLRLSFLVGMAADAGAEPVA